jgi:uncharacterized protein
VARSRAPAALGGTVLGVGDGAELAGACFSGGNLIPVGGRVPEWHALAEAVLRRPRVCTSIVGRAEAVASMWEVLADGWGPARAIRSAQPLLVLDAPAAIESADWVRLAEAADTDRYVAASAAMFTEELGFSPLVAGAGAFAARVGDLIRARRAFASFDFRGQVIFKADIGALTPRTCQVQGVWVRPDRRGRGIGTAGLATVIRHALTLAPTVSLYVNDFNAPARRIYAKLGMRHHATLATVLLCGSTAVW